MNFNLLFNLHMMNQLNGLHHPPHLGHHHSRFQEPLHQQHQQERMSEMQKSVSASLAQLTPYNERLMKPGSAVRYSDPEHDTPQDLSLRYPGHSGHSGVQIKHDPSPPPPVQTVKTEPEDPGYSHDHHHLQHHPLYHPPPPPEHLSRSYSLPAREEVSEARLVNTVRQRSLDRGPGPSGRGQETKPSNSNNNNSNSRDKDEVNSSRTIIEFDNNDHVLCRVCGDKASGFHYGVHSCEGCKGFFRRSIQQKINYRPCTKNQQCTIQRINRNRCQYCRLKKCMAAGMSRDAVRFGRVPKREKAKITAAMESSRLKNMENRVMAEMVDDAKIIETVVRAHFDTCDYTADKIKPFIAKAHQEKQFTQCTGMTCPMKGRPEQSFLDTFSERFMNHVRQVCTFAKSIPGFKCLHHDDQVCLLKSCIFEVLLVRLSGLFDNQRLVCLNGDVIKRETISAMPAGNAKFLLDSVFELAQRINRFRLADAEIGLFCAVVIIAADRPGLRNPEIVGQMQSKLKMVLQNILAPQHPDNATIFTELLTILHDLRTLNTLHTEKFLQQARVTGEQVREATTCQVSRVATSPPSVTSLQQHLLYGRDERDWEQDNQDRDSTGSRSPQSSDSHVTHHSYRDSYEDMRRSPIGSVSSSESLGSSETFSKLSVNDLKIHGVGSVLLNALTSPAMTAASVTCPLNRKRDISRCTSESNISVRGQSESGGSGGPDHHTPAESGSPASAKCPFKSRKLDSPSDSGIDSPKAQGSQSTNTSVCSSPRSSMEDKVKEVEEENSAAGASSSSSSVSVKSEKNETLEEQHPLLKRALQQPPQPFNIGVTGFQDEVYHKKFRHSGRKDSNEPTSTQEPGSSSGARSPSPVSSGHSILASQLAAPPSYSAGSSVLASTLSRPVSIPGARESEQRNQWLANLILDRQRPVSGGSTSQESLVVCVPQPAHTNNIPPSSPGAGSSSSWSPSGQRHIPVPVAPTQASPRPSTGSSASSAAATKNPHLKMALAGKSPVSSQPVTQGQSSSSSDTQPLNLSTRTPPPADISTEA